MPATAVLFFENCLGRVVLEAAGYIRLQWLPGPRAAGALRAVLAQLLRAQLQTGSAHLLLDERLAAPFAAADQDWLINEWLPQAVTYAGPYYAAPYYAAHLLSDDVFTRLSEVAVLEKARRLGFHHRPFQQEAEALRWLGQQP